MSDRSRHRSFVPCISRALALLCLLLLAEAPAAARGYRGGPDTIRVVPGFVVVKFKQGTESSATANGTAAVSPAFARCGVYALQPMFNLARLSKPQEATAGRTDLSRICLATIPADSDTRRVAAEISRLSEVEYAEPRFSYPILDVPDDSLLNWQQASFSLMNVFAGWSIARGQPTVIIATIDGGTNWRHEDLAPNLWVNEAEDLNHNGRLDTGPPPLGDEDGIDNDGNGRIDDPVGWNFTTGTNDPAGIAWQTLNPAHGTSITSLSSAATNNGRGIAGTSWNCRLMPVCAADPMLDGYVEYGPEGIVYAFQNGASVVNLSWGGRGEPSRVLQDVVDAASEAGAFVVAAAGNSQADNDADPLYPASCEHVLAVGATRSSDDALAGFSNHGATVPVYACGVGIWGAKADGSYGNAGSGTSLSCSLVAGLAGLLKSAHPAWTPAQIGAQIKMTADAIDGVPANVSLAGTLGCGRVNFGRALAELGHAGVEITRGMLHSGWRTELIPGDSLTLSLTVRNVLFAPATGLQFTVRILDSAIVALSGISAPGTLQPGEEVALPDVKFKLGAVKAPRNAVVAVDWESNGNNRNHAAFSIRLNPKRPVWEVQLASASNPLRSVKAVDRNVAWAVGGAIGPRALRTSDAGLTWHDATGNLHGNALTCVDALDALHAWCGTDSGTIMATSDGGTNWFPQTCEGVHASLLCGIKFLDAANGICMGNPPAGQTRFVLLRTTNGGATWVHLSSEPAGNPGEFATPNSFCWVGARHGWFGTNQSRIWHTSDGGRSWRAEPTGFTADSPASAIVFTVDFRDSLYGVAYHPSPYLVRSTDGGNRWSCASGSLGGAASEGPITFAPGSSWVWLASGRRMFVSTDGGAVWTVETVSATTGLVCHLSAAATSLGGSAVYTGWAVTDSGEVLRAEYSTTGVAEDSRRLPASVVLYQNYPNPFNPSTTIRYTLPHRVHVTLTVYNTLGQNVATLVNDDIDAGPHEVRFNAGNLASGLYYYRLLAGGHANTRPFVLLR